jgi:glutamate-1-semialdehyde 2,1-aminomutase
MGAKSRDLFERARKVIPGGVNSPVRACKAVGMDPLFIARAKGGLIWDADGKSYVDYVCSWGPMILGHAHPEVTRAIREAAEGGSSFGAPTEAEVRMAELIVEMVPSVDMVRMVNSGTEAVMSAVRLARGYTAREKIIKFEGCYHGHVDSLLVSAGSGVATLGLPGTPGVPVDLAKQTISLPYNDLDAVEQAYAGFPAEIAAVIVEPVAGNMGVVLPKEGFLEGLREITRRHGSLLIFDEVITGFRLAPGGAQEIYGIDPDLTCLGKIIGGGLPVGAYGGKREIMKRMAPEGNIYQAGTLSGNPLAMAAGLATLGLLRNSSVYEELAQKGDRLFGGLRRAAEAAGVGVTVNALGSMGTLFFTKGPVIDFRTAKAGDETLFRSFYRNMLELGIYLAPSAYEAAFLSTAHDEALIEKTLAAAKTAFRSMAS